jgi:hypothetical protein
MQASKDALRELWIVLNLLREPGERAPRVPATSLVLEVTPDEVRRLLLAEYATSADDCDHSTGT